MTIACAVLAGGASQRMGRTKALIDVDGRAMADRVLDAARGLGIESLVIVGGDVDELEGLSAPVIEDLFPGEGPVGGVLSALDHFADSEPGVVPIESVLVLPCDLVDVTAEALWPLVEACAGDAHGRAWVAATDRLEPMCAIWAIEASAVVRRSFSGGERALHRVLGELPHTTVTIDAAALRNVNRPTDLWPIDQDRNPRS